MTFTVASHRRTTAHRGYLEVMVNRVFSPSALFAADKLRVAARSGSPVNMEAIFSQVCGGRGACGVWVMVVYKTSNATWRPFSLRCIVSRGV